MPRFSQNYGFVYEDPNSDQPLSSLTGGSSGTYPILAEQVDDELSRVEGQVIADLDDRVAILEAVPSPPGWVKIDSGSVSNVATFVIPAWEAEAYTALRLRMQGTASAAGNIRVRCDDDNTADLHTWGLLVWDMGGDLEFNNFDATDTFWQVGQWGTGTSNLELLIFNTGTEAVATYQSTAFRIGGAAGTTTRSFGGGRINSPRLVNTLRVSGPPGGGGSETITATWWLEGAPA